MRAFIEQRRKAAKITQSDVAKQMKVSRRTYQRFEEGDCRVEQLQELGVILKFKVILIPLEML